MKQLLSLLFLFFIIFVYPVFQDKLYPEDMIRLPVFPEDMPNGNIDSAAKPEKLKNINLDMNALYGIQYNQMFSSFSLSQERNTFVYLLTSNFNRSADFGYNDKIFLNSGFYENTVGLTANWNLTNAKLILEGGADNESRGMFENDVYSREEKGNTKLSAKTIYKLSPSIEVFFLLGGAWYKHSLIAIVPSDLEKSRVLQGNVEAGFEYVWSASNRMRLNADLLYYDYRPEELETDRHFKGEIIDDFNFTRNIGVSIGVGYVDNKEYKHNRFPLAYGASLSFKGFKYINSTFAYKFDITPFQPEEFYLKQKYINPNYNLPPGMIHSGEINTDLRVNSILNLRSNFKIEKNKYYYNFFPVRGNVLSAYVLEVISFNAGLEAGFSLPKGVWEVVLSYNYFYFSADQNITYEPDHEASTSIRYNGKNWKFEWSNAMRGSVYTNPSNNEKLPESFIGTLGIQRRMLEGSYLYFKIENLYNNKYSSRKGYPEPGISFLFGLRILI